MNIRDALRTAILATNPHWPFSVVNKYPYYLAIKFFIRLCSHYPAVLSVYLRSGLVERAWVPAISDIDFVVIIDSHLSEADELSLLQRFWRQFAALKSFFPMIGEVDIVTDRHIPSWIRFGFTGQTAHKWRLVYGAEAIPKGGAADPRRFSRDCLNYSLHWSEWYSRSYFAGRFFTRDEDSALLARDLSRLGSKVFRSLQHVSLEAANKNLLDDSCHNEHELCARLIIVMEAAIRRLDLADDGAQPASARSEWSDQFVSAQLPPIRQQDALDTSALAPWNDLLECVLFDSNDELYLVFRDGLDIQALAICLSALRRTINGRDKPVTAVSRTTFTYIFRHYLPFDFAHVLRQRRLIFGKDLVLEIMPPARSACADFLLGQVPNLIGFAQGRAFHSEAQLNAASLLERGLLLRLLLEDDVIAPLPEIFLLESERHYPKETRMLRALRTGGASPDRAEFFATFKMLAEKIHMQLENAPIEMLVPR